MANRHTLCCLILIPSLISAVYFLNSAQGGNGNHEFQTVSGCSCQGYTVTFQCKVFGRIGWITWIGSAFDCSFSGNEIRFPFPDNFQNGGRIKTCNKGDIVGQTLLVEGDNVYASQLNVTLTPHLIGRTVKCIRVNAIDHEETIGAINLSLTTDPFLPPLDVHLADVGQGFLKFKWSPALNNCVPLLYDVKATESCGSCRDRTTFTSVSCTLNFSHIPGVCWFAIRTTVCDNITGNWSEPVNVTLKVPDPVVISAIRADYTADGSLTALAIEFRGSDQDMCNRDIAGYIHNYSIVYADAVTGLICNSDTTSNLTSFAPRSCFPTNNSILVSLSAMNILGEGSKINTTIAKTNQYISLSTSAKGITCRFLDEQKQLSTKLCNISYGRCTEVQDSWASQWDYTTTDSPFTVNLNLKTDLQDYCYVVSATVDNLTTVVTGSHTSKGGGAQQRWKFLAFLVIICMPPVIVIVAFVYWARYRCLCIIAELVSKVVCSHSNGNNMEYPMHAAFELQDKPGELLKLLTILKDRGINIETTKIGKHTSVGIGKIYMRFTRDLTPDEVHCVKTKFESLKSSTSCIIHKSPRPFQIELAETMDGTSARPISQTTYSLLVRPSPGALQSFLQGMMKLKSRDGSQYNKMNITGIVDIPITLCKRRLGYLIKLNLCNAPGSKFPRNWWRDLDSIQFQTAVAIQLDFLPALR